MEKFLGVPVEIPNYATFAKGIAEGDTSLMKGDEEIARSKYATDWCGRPTRGYVPLSIDPERHWRALLGLPTPSSPEALGALGALGALPKPLDPIEVAVTAVATIDTEGIVTGAGLPVGPIRRMFAALGLDESHAREAMRICLRNWQDVNKADREATAFLVNPNGVAR